MSNSGNVKDLAIKKAIMFLQAAKCKFHIVSEEGEEFGNPIEGIKRAKYGYGSLVNHMKEHLENMKSGEIRSVDVGSFDIDAIQASACNYMRHTYGKDSYTCSRSSDKKSVSVLLAIEPA